MERFFNLFERLVAAFETLASVALRNAGGAAVSPVADPGPVKEDAPKKRGRKKMSPAARKAVSERMRKYWADRRKNG